jgi:hypothetical protein
MCPTAEFNRVIGEELNTSRRMYLLVFRRNPRSVVAEETGTRRNLSEFFLKTLEGIRSFGTHSDSKISKAQTSYLNRSF